MARTVLPPGFRFHPTDPELVIQYLRRKASGRKIAEGVIGDLEIYKHEPWELPDKAILDTKDQEWYFFSMTDKKYPQGSRTSRTTARGYWKATGKDRQIYSGTGCVGMKKTLVFYMGRVPHGKRTDWLMHEYRLDEVVEKTISNIQPFVLCRVRKKGGIGPQNGEQFGALHEPCEPESSTSFAVLLPELSESIAIQEVVEDSGEADKAADLAAEIECHQSGDELEDDLNFLLSHDPPSLYVDHNNVIQDLPGEGSGDIFTLDPGNALSKGHYAGTGGSGSGFQGDAMDALHDLVHPTSEEREMLEELLYDCSGTQQDEQNLLVQSQIMNPMDDGFLDGFFELDDLEVPIDDLPLDLPPVFDEGEDDSLDVEVNSWFQPRTRAIFDPGEYQVPHIVSHRVRLQVPTPLAVGHDGANNAGGSQNKEANVYYHGEYPSAMEVPMLISGDRNSLGFQNVLGRRIEDGATSSNALSGFDCASGVFVNTYVSNTSSGTLTCEQLPAQSFNVRSLGSVDWQEGTPVEGEGSYSASGADATAHMSLAKGDGASCSIRETSVWGEEKVSIAKGPVVLLKEINRLSCATVPPPAHSPKFFSQLVLGVLGKAPAKPAFAAELPGDARLIAALCESRRAQEEQGCTADMALQRSFSRSSTSLSQRSKSPISSELNCYLKGCAGRDEISGLPSSDIKVVSTIGNGGGIRIFFRVATSLLIFACLSRGMCRLTRIALTIF